MSFPFPVLALTLPEYPTLAESLQYQVTGLLVVLFALGSLAILVGLVGRIFAALEERRTEVRPATAATTPARTTVPATTEEISPAVLAAIAAAVSATLGDRRFTIRGVQVADPRQNAAWSAEGRRTIYASHNVR